jgi:ATP-binding cassette subfamily F protein uup
MHMPLITLENLSKSYGMKSLFKNINLIINDEDKIGLIGINGTGKSTLLKIIAGYEPMDTGKITMAKKTSIEFLSQSPQFYDDLTVIEQVFKGDSEALQVLRSYEAALEKSIKDPNDTDLSNDVMKYSDMMTRLDLWELESQVKTILTKLSIHDFDQPVNQLSGGQKKRLALASALITPCDLLILDEPTNHMDNATIDSLQSYLERRKGALLMITHDRYFLDRVTNRIVEIDHSSIYSYEGNYTTFLQKKMERMEMAESQERKRENLYKRELAWIRRGAKARTTKQKARIDRFEQLEDTSFLRDDNDVHISVGFTRLGKKTIELDHLSKTYDDNQLFKDFSYTVLKDDRIGIIGPNGAGKTTLLNCIIGKTELSSGVIDIGPTLNISYFSQESEDMDPSLRAIDFIKETAEYISTEDGSKLSASVMLEKFLFDDELQYAPIYNLSGGEKRRLYLLKNLMMAPNVLILDEPTNDLDIDTLKVLEAYIDDFKGIVISVSHDRYFLDRICNKIFSFDESGQIIIFTGNYSDYMAYKAEYLTNTQTSTASSADPTTKTQRVKTEQLKMSYQEKKDYETIESEMSKLEDQLAEVESDLAKYQTDFVKLQELTELKEQLEDELLEKMSRFEYLENLYQEINS